MTARVWTDISAGTRRARAGSPARRMRARGCCRISRSRSGASRVGHTACSSRRAPVVPVRTANPARTPVGAVPVPRRRGVAALRQFGAGGTHGISALGTSRFATPALGRPRAAVRQFGIRRLAVRQVDTVGGGRRGSSAVPRQFGIGAAVRHCPAVRQSRGSRRSHDGPAAPAAPTAPAANGLGPAPRAQGPGGAGPRRRGRPPLGLDASGAVRCSRSDTAACQSFVRSSDGRAGALRGCG
jgi:hypothetical protein